MIAVSNYSHEFVAKGTPKYRGNYSISQHTPCFSSSSAGVKVLVTSKALTLFQSLDRISSKTCLDDIFHVHVICIGIVINNNNHLVWSGLVQQIYTVVEGTEVFVGSTRHNNAKGAQHY